MLERILCNDHFLLGLGLAAGPAIIILGVVFFWLRSGIGKKSLGLVDNEGTSIWRKIDTMENRQVDLRQNLPNEYVRKEYMGNIDTQLTNIGIKLDAFMDDCRKGLCGAGARRSQL